MIVIDYPPLHAGAVSTDTAPHTFQHKQAESTSLLVDPGGHMANGVVYSDSIEQHQQETDGTTVRPVNPGGSGINGWDTGERGQFGTNGLATGASEPDIYGMNGIIKNPGLGRGDQCELALASGALVQESHLSDVRESATNRTSDRDGGNSLPQASANESAPAEIYHLERPSLQPASADETASTLTHDSEIASVIEEASPPKELRPRPFPSSLKSIPTPHAPEATNIADEAGQPEEPQPQPPLNGEEAGILAPSHALEITNVGPLGGPQPQSPSIDRATNTPPSHALGSTSVGERISQKPPLANADDTANITMPYATLGDIAISESGQLEARPQELPRAGNMNGTPLSWVTIDEAHHREGTPLRRASIISAASTGDEMLHHSAAEIKVSIGSRLIRKLDSLQRLGNQVLQMRVQLAQNRRKLRHHRSALRDSDADFMKAVDEAWAMGTLGSPHLKDLYAKIREERDALGPLDEAYDEFEDRVDRLDYKLQSLETQFYTTTSELMEGADGGAGVFVETEDAAESTSSSGESETPRYHPLQYDFLSKIGDANIVKERLEDLEFDYMQILEEEKIRNPYGIPLSRENFEFLNEYKSDRAQLEQEARNLEVTISKLRQKCIDEGVMEQDQEDQELTSQFPYLAGYGRKYGELISGFTSTRDRVNRWLLDILRSSFTEATLYCSFETDAPVNDAQWDRIFSAIFEQFWLTNDSAAAGDPLSPINSPTGSQESLAASFSSDRRLMDQNLKSQLGRQPAGDPVLPDPIKGFGDLFPDSGISIPGTLSVRKGRNYSVSSADFSDILADSITGSTYTCRDETSSTPNPYRPHESPPRSPVLPRAYSRPHEELFSLGLDPIIVRP